MQALRKGSSPLRSTKILMSLIGLMVEWLQSSACHVGGTGSNPVGTAIFLQESEFGVMVSTRDGASEVKFESLAPTTK